MKSKVLIPVIFLFLALVTSCQKQADESAQNQASKNSLYRKVARVDTNEKAYQQMKAENEARLALMNNNAPRGGCVQTAVVPDEYATIQEAMDAVCQNGTIIVKDGEYNENVLIDKSGLTIKAIGDVTVNGVFYLYPNLLKIEISNFIIKPVGPSEQAYNGIYGYGIHGAEIRQNTIIGVGDKGFAIILDNSNGITIEQNQVSDFSWGIILRSVDGGKSSSNNKILDNTITGITYATCLGLEGDCNNNLILGNIVTQNSSPINGGICILCDESGAYLPDRNVVKNNTVTYNYYTGILLDGGSQNIIGPDNICDNTYGVDGIGVYLTAQNIKTKVISNTVLDNYVCDIVYEFGADIEFSGNTFGCLQEW